jgi:CheY-like chemotaxis protein
MLQEDLQTAGLTEYDSSLAQMQDSAHGLLDIVNDMLDLSQVETGKIEFFLENTSIPTLIQEIKPIVYTALQKNNNTLAISIAPNIDVIYTDPARVRQTLRYLLTNASKFTKDSVITLEVKPSPDDMIQFSVTVEKANILASQLKKLFQSFSKTNDVDVARQYGNTGLEFYLTRRFCEMLGGGIAIESHEEKNTIVFSISLPTKTISGSKKTAFTPMFSEVSHFGKSTILIIDSTPYTHKKIQDILGQEGFTVLHAFNAEEGLKLAKSHKPAPVVLDIPEVITIDIMAPATMDSWAVLSALRSERHLAKTPVIVISNISKENLGLTLKGVTYLPKSTNVDMLVEKIRNFLPETV